MAHFQVLIIGGGNAGISTAAQLLRKNKGLQIAIIEPSDKHYYQPAWTLVGAGVFDIKKTIRTEASVIPPNVKWLKEAVGKNGVTSNYSYMYAPYTYQCLKAIKPGDTILFTAPSTPTKCGGAPQKVMYMTADFLRRKGILKDVTLEFVSGGSMLFGVKKYAASLQQMVDKYGINLHFRYDLTSIDSDKKEATFRLMDGLGSVTITKKYDM